MGIPEPLKRVRVGSGAAGRRDGFPGLSAHDLRRRLYCGRRGGRDTILVLYGHASQELTA